MTKFNDFLKEQLADPEVKAAYDAVIKDSGDRTAFDTGAVRDICTRARVALTYSPALPSLN